MIAKLTRWARTWWLTVPEPREISMIYTLIYAAALGTGICTLVIPPPTIQHIAAPPTLAFIGYGLVVGAALAAAGGYWEVWALERGGLVLIAAALAGIGVLLIALQHVELGARVLQLGVLVLAISVLVVRWVMIRIFTYRPRG